MRIRSNLKPYSKIEEGVIAMSTKPVRIIYDNSSQTGFPEHQGKVFAVIGPFDDHLDKADLQKALKRVLVEHNSAIGHGPVEEVRAAVSDYVTTL